MTIDLQGMQKDAEISVKNLDAKNNAYVEITAYRLANPANPTTPKQRVRHPEKEGLVVFPAKLILLPGQTQFVRVLKTAENLSSDQVYEIDLIPKISTHLVTTKAPSGANLGIRVIVGYGARVIARPDTISSSLSLKRINNELVINNTGNTALTITSCRQNIAGKPKEISLSAYTLFAGKTIKAKLTQKSRVTLEVACMGKALAPYYVD